MSGHLDAAAPVTVEIGLKDGIVVMNVPGTPDVPPNFVAWNPAEARRVAAKLIELADLAEGKGP